MNEMRIPAASKVKEANTPAERLRDQLKHLEALLGKLAPGSDSAEALEILRRFDQAHKLISQFQKTNIDLAAERARLDTLTQQTKRKAGLLLKVIGGAGKLQALRSEHNPPPSHWWWFLDEYVRDRIREQRRKTLRTVGILAAVLAVLVVLYNLLLAPDPETRARYQLEQEAERALINGENATALANVNEALEQGERTADLLILKGVILLESDQSEEAEIAFAEARQSLPDAETFFLTRAQIYLRLGNPELALDNAQSALEENPDSAYGYYIAGTALAGLSRFREAEQSLEKASDLAGEQGNAQLQGMARVQIANLSMMLDAPPTQSVTPESE